MVTKRSKGAAADPMQVVSRFVDAANHHDADALRACVHHNFESIQPIHPGRNFRGSGQLISNWKAIFEAEPGFRLTVLRSAVEDDTVWVELHGAGDSNEAAGIFIIGVEDGRIRWIRVYSDLVEPAPPEVEPAPPPEVEAVSVADADGAAEVTEEEPQEPAADADDEHAASAAVAVGDDTEVFDRPLRLVEAGHEEAPAEDAPEAEDPGAAAALHLVHDEDGAEVEGEPEADVEGAGTGDLLDLPTEEAADEDDAAAEVEGAVVETDSPDVAVIVPEESWDQFGPREIEEADAAPAVTADLTTEDETADLTTEDETADLTTEDETADLTTEDETAEPETSDDVALEETADLVTEDEAADPDAVDDTTEDVGDVTADAEATDSDADEDEAGASQGGGSPAAARAIPELAEPTSPPLPRAKPRRPTEEEKPALRRKWRWMRNSSSER